MTIHECVPYLSLADANKAVEYYTRVFQVEPALCLRMPDGRILHAEFNFGHARLFLSDELPEHGGTPSPSTIGATTVAVHLYVDDCDATVARMTDHGAQVLMPPTDMFYGERFARVLDPFGQSWGIATRLHDMSPADIQSEVDKLFEQ